MTLEQYMSEAISTGKRHTYDIPERGCTSEEMVKFLESRGVTGKTQSIYPLFSLESKPIQYVLYTCPGEDTGWITVYNSHLQSVTISLFVRNNGTNWACARLGKGTKDIDLEFDAAIECILMMIKNPEKKLTRKDINKIIDRFATVTYTLDEAVSTGKHNRKYDILDLDELRVGDRVRVKSKDDILSIISDREVPYYVIRGIDRQDGIYKDYYFNQRMINHSGKVFTVDDIDRFTGAISLKEDRGRWNWNIALLEPV